MSKEGHHQQRTFKTSVLVTLTADIRKNTINILVKKNYKLQNIGYVLLTIQQVKAQRKKAEKNSQRNNKGAKYKEPREYCVFIK